MSGSRKRCRADRTWSDQSWNEGEARCRLRRPCRRRQARPHLHTRWNYRHRSWNCFDFRAERYLMTTTTTESRAATTASDSATSLLPTYKRAPMKFVRGEGVELIDSDGKRYLDLASGIAVNALGYGDQGIVQAIIGALNSGLVHV